MPDNWILSESGSGEGLYSFLSSVISHTLHQKRSTKSAYWLSDKELLNVNCDLAKAKKAHIKITPDKKCAVCMRSIGDKVFVVYPNIVAAQHTFITAKGLSICPLTG